MCDHKKKEANVPKQTSQATHTVHTHTNTHAYKGKLNTLHQRGWEGAYLKRPQDFRVAKTKVAIDRCRMLTPYALCVCLCEASVTFPPPSLSTSALAICYLCNVYVWMVNICKYPDHSQPIYMRIYSPHFPFSIYAAASTPNKTFG